MIGDHIAPSTSLITHALHCRPGYHSPTRVDTPLHRTCRRIYLETYLLPLMLNEIVVWCSPSRGPPGTTNHWKPLHTIEQRAVSKSHLFLQQYWLERSWVHLAAMPGFNPLKLQITIRHTDWWHWEYGEPLYLDPMQAGTAYETPSFGSSDLFSEKSWGYAFRNLHGLKEFVLELETVESKKSELDAIVSRARTWQFQLADDEYLVLDQRKTTYSAWRGLNRFEKTYGQANPTLDQPVSPYQSPRLKPKIVGIMEEMLHEATTIDPDLIACIPPYDDDRPIDTDSALILYIPSAGEPDAGEKIRNYPGRQHTANEYAQRLRTYRHAKWSSAGGRRVEGGPAHAELAKELANELEELSALQYYVVKLTWNC